MRKAGNGGLVYSTDGGRMCPACRNPVSSCKCVVAAESSRGDGRVRVSRETKGRAGKSVTLIRGLDLDPLALHEFGKRLKTACATGGTTKDGVIELQGDQCDRALEWLRHEGIDARRGGG